MLYLQAGRRLYECVALTPRKRSPPSRMWIGHYLLGMAFYAALPLAALAEYVPHVLRAPRPKLAAFFVEPDTGRPALLHTAPSLRTAVLVPLLMLLAGVQHDAHAYLAGLRDYVVPRHFLFARLVAPHYTAEVAIYFVLALLLAPVGATLNLTMASAAVFVAVNLGVTARRSLQWYRAKFGEHAVSGRFVLVPFMW